MSALVSFLSYKPLSLNLLSCSLFPIDFVHVLRSFSLLLIRLQDNLFKDQDSGYPAVVFNTIKDNPRFEDLTAAPGGSWSVEWVPSFVNNTQELPGFADTLPIIIQCLCEQLQHTRFKEIRPLAVEVACKVC